MSYNTPYKVTQLDKAAFRELNPEDAAALLHHLQWHRYQLALYVRGLAAHKPIDKEAALTALDALPQLLEKKGLHDLADHFVVEIATLRDQVARSHHRPGLEAGQAIKIGFHIKNAEDQLRGVFGGIGGTSMSGTSMGRTPGTQDAKVDLAHKEFVAAIEAEALERYVRDMQLLRQQRADIKKQHSQLFSKVQDFLKKLPEADLVDVFFHALDENQSLPQAINQRVRTTLGNQAVRDMIVASINGPKTALEAIPHAIGSVLTGKPMFSVETDQTVVAERIEAIQQERANAQQLDTPINRRDLGGRGGGGLGM